MGENWPCFRGPTHQGISTETGLPLTWNATNNILWKTEIPQLGWSSPIIWGDRVFLTTALEDGKSLHLLCLDAKSGAIQWDKEVMRQNPIRKDDGNSFATPTPVTDGQRVYIVSFNGAFAAVTFDGSIAWTNTATTFYIKHGLAASPALEGDVLVLPCDGTSTGDDSHLGWDKPWNGSYVIGVDMNTGKTRWKTMRGTSRVAFSSPNIAVLNGRTQAISAAGDVVQGFDLESGELLWTGTNPGEGVVPSAVVGDGMVFTTSGFNTGTGRPAAIRAFRPSPGARTITGVWEQTNGVPNVASFIYTQSNLFVVDDSGRIQCLNAQTGEIIWKNRLIGKHEPSPVLADGRLYCLSSTGRTTVLSAGPKFEKLAENILPERCGASIAVSGKRLFIRTENNLYCIGQ